MFLSRTFSGLFNNVLKMFSGCSDRSCGPSGSAGSRRSAGSCGSSGFGGSCESEWLGGSCESCGSGWGARPG